AVAHEIPHDEEIAGEAEALNEIQLLAQLRLHFLGDAGAVPLARTFPGHTLQEVLHAHAIWRVVAREFIAEVFQGKVELCSETLRIRYGISQITEEFAHLRSRLQMAFGILLQQA